MRRLDFVEKTTLRRDLPPFRVGDTVRVHVKVREGEKERIQAFEGVVIKRHDGARNLNSTFTVRKVSQGFGVERIFPFHSPLIESILVVRQGRVRRAKLYFLRQRSGRKARLREKAYA